MYCIENWDWCTVDSRHFDMYRIQSWDQWAVDLLLTKYILTSTVLKLGISMLQISEIKVHFYMHCTGPGIGTTLNLAPMIESQ